MSSGLDIKKKKEKQEEHTYKWLCLPQKVVVSWGNQMWLQQHTDISTASFMKPQLRATFIFFRPQTAELVFFFFFWNHPISTHNSNEVTTNACNMFIMLLDGNVLATHCNLKSSRGTVFGRNALNI